MSAIKDVIKTVSDFRHLVKDIQNQQPIDKDEANLKKDLANVVDDVSALVKEGTNVEKDIKKIQSDIKKFNPDALKTDFESLSKDLDQVFQTLTGKTTALIDKLDKAIEDGVDIFENVLKIKSDIKSGNYQDIATLLDTLKSEEEDLISNLPINANDQQIADHVVSLLTPVLKDVDGVVENFIDAKKFAKATALMAKVVVQDIKTGASAEKLRDDVGSMASGIAHILEISSQVAMQGRDIYENIKQLFKL